MITVSILMENSLVGHRGLEAEHGLSVLIEDEGHSILFDTGSSSLFLDNAKRLKKDLSKISSVVLSHPHYDHSGGFLSFADQWETERKRLYTGKDFFSDRFEENSFSYTFLGNGFSKEDLIERGIECSTVESPVRISPHCWVVTGFRQRNALESVPSRFKKRHEKGFVPDLFSDECSIVVESPGALHLIVGCAHIGILNIVEHVSREFSKPVKGVYGGIHLMNSSADETGLILERLTGLGVEKFGLCHCSGALVYEYLHDHMQGIEVAALGSGSMLLV